MTTQFALDVYLARAKSGYTQDDIAHLLEISRSKIARFERGKKEPSLSDLLGLSLVYGRSFESFYAEKLQNQRRAILEKVRTLPDLAQPTVKHANRDKNLLRMARRLEADLEIHDRA